MSPSTGVPRRMVPLGRCGRADNRGSCCIRALFLLVLLACGGLVWRTVSSRPLRPSLFGEGKAVSIVVLGTDASEKRADLIYQVLLSPSKTTRVAIIQIPRDTRVVLRGRPRKLNSVMAEGKQRLLGLVGALTGSSPQRYIVLTFESAVAVLEALCPRGIEIENPTAIDFTFSRSEGAYHLVVPKGTVRVSPRDFFMICRLRQSLGDTRRKNGDVAARQPRQARMLSYLLRELAQDKDPGVLWRLPRVARRIDTNLTQREMLALVWRYRKMRTEDLRVLAAPGSPCRGGLWQLDKSQLARRGRTLSAWVQGVSLVHLTVLTSGDAGLQELASALQGIDAKVQVHMETLAAPLPHSWIAYSDGVCAEETRRNARLAKTLALKMHLPAPHHEQGAADVILALGRDLDPGPKENSHEDLLCASAFLVASQPGADRRISAVDSDRGTQ